MITSILLATTILAAQPAKPVYSSKDTVEYAFLGMFDSDAPKKSAPPEATATSGSASISSAGETYWIDLKFDGEPVFKRENGAGYVVLNFTSHVDFKGLAIPANAKKAIKKFKYSSDGNLRVRVEHDENYLHYISDKGSVITIEVKLRPGKNAPDDKAAAEAKKKEEDKKTAEDKKKKEDAKKAEAKKLEDKKLKEKEVEKKKKEEAKKTDAEKEKKKNEELKKAEERKQVESEKKKQAEEEKKKAAEKEVQKAKEELKKTMQTTTINWTPKSKKGNIISMLRYSPERGADNPLVQKSGLFISSFSTKNLGACSLTITFFAVTTLASP